ncbi:MAG: hypothetical protein K2H97_06165 [Prevotella sp.]|nr:hypothetical protein [Prevotella sp.]
MIKNLKISTILFAFAMQIIGVASLSASDVPLYYKHTPKDNGAQMPSKAPAKEELTLNVYFDEEIQQLAFSDLSDNIYTYYIYDEDENIISQGTLNLSTNNIVYIDVIAKCGTYTLNVVYNGQNYVGTFGVL